MRGDGDREALKRLMCGERWRGWTRGWLWGGRGVDLLRIGCGHGGGEVKEEPEFGDLYFPARGAPGQRDGLRLG